MADRPTSYVAKTAPGHLKLYRQPTNKIAGITEATAAHLRRLT